MGTVSLPDCRGATVFFKGGVNLDHQRHGCAGTRGDVQLQGGGIARNPCFVAWSSCEGNCTPPLVALVGLYATQPSSGTSNVLTLQNVNVYSDTVTVHTELPLRPGLLGRLHGGRTPDHRYGCKRQQPSPGGFL